MEAHALVQIVWNAIGQKRSKYNLLLHFAPPSPLLWTSLQEEQELAEKLLLRKLMRQQMRELKHMQRDHLKRAEDQRFQQLAEHQRFVKKHTIGNHIITEPTFKRK